MDYKGPKTIPIYPGDVAEAAHPEYVKWLEGQLAVKADDDRDYKAEYEIACKTIAEMHSAAVGEVCGPKRGIVEDVADLKARADNAEARVKELEAENKQLFADVESLNNQIHALTPSDPPQQQAKGETKLPKK